MATTEYCEYPFRPSTRLTFNESCIPSFQTQVSNNLVGLLNAMDTLGEALFTHSNENITITSDNIGWFKDDVIC